MKNITRKTIIEDCKTIEALFNKYSDAIWSFKEGEGSKSNFDNQPRLVKIAMIDARTGLHIASQGKSKWNKVEQKFKVGDWIVGANNVLKIISLNDELNCYIAVTTNNEEVKIPYYFDDGQGHMCSYHLWTIDDAKDGDVLANKNAIFIFKCKYRNGSSLCRSYLGIIGTSESVSLDFDFGIIDVHPATKEQRDNLNKILMANQGVIFDFEKRELKKIEPKNYKQQLMSEITDLVKDYIKQEFAWSEEDEYQINTILHGLDMKKEIYKKRRKQSRREQIQYNWLKSLKERVHLQNTEH